jgi:preprotein translocase subunit SecD
MKKNVLRRLIIILVVTLVALYIVIGPRRAPRLSDFTFAGINNTLRENIRLGLDLRGGTQLIMQVQAPRYLSTLTGNNAQAIQIAARENNLAVGEVRADVSGDNYRIIVPVTDESKVDEIRNRIPERVDLEGWAVARDGNNLVWSLTSEARTRLGEQATEQAMSIIDSRLSPLGVTEPTLQRHGAPTSHQILLQMPGLQDPERAKNIIGGESRLRLMSVVGATNPAPITTYDSREAAIQSLGGTIPNNREVLAYTERDEPTTPAGQTDPNTPRPTRWVVVESPAVVEGSDLRSAAAVSRTGRETDYQIEFTLKPSGAEKFGRWTGANINRYMAVVLNDEVKSAPFIRQQITDRGEISGSFRRASAEDLALTLRSGALPAPIVFQEERTVSASLGADSIRAGVRASLAGLIFIIVFMVFYYRGSGVNAVVALLLNVIITLAALVFFNATLTLPGIAGLILGLGMAVDSNVLIFERIREELQAGKTVPSAVEQGFARAFITIIDTHVTVVVSAAFLFVFGTGPIRGFAVTLVLGLLANLFSAVFVSRTIFMWVLNRKGQRAESLSI